MASYIQFFLAYYYYYYFRKYLCFWCSFFGMMWVRESGYQFQSIICLPSEERTSCSICSKMSLLFDWVWQLLHWFSCGCYQPRVFSLLFIYENTCICNIQDLSYIYIYIYLFCEFKCHSTEPKFNIHFKVQPPSSLQQVHVLCMAACVFQTKLNIYIYNIYESYICTLRDSCNDQTLNRLQRV